MADGVPPCIVPSKKSATRQRAREKAQIKKLRDLGLVSKRVSLRAKPTPSVKRALRKFADVLQGRAAVVEVPKDVAKRMRGAQRVVGNRIVVEKQKGERVRYDKKTKQVIGKRRAGSKTFTRTFTRDLKSVAPAKSGLRRYYVVPFQRGGGDVDYLKFDELGELELFMGEYERSGYKNWKDYVEIIDVENREELNEAYPHDDSASYLGTTRHVYGKVNRSKLGKRTTKRRKRK